MYVTESRRESELHQLRERISSGSYCVSPREVADAILDGGWVAAARPEPPPRARRRDGGGLQGLRPPLAA